MTAEFYAIIGVGVSLAVMIYTMTHNTRSMFFKEILDLSKRFDDKLDILNARIDELSKKVDGQGGKIAIIDARLIEVEKHLFAIRTLLNYDLDVDKRNKEK